MSRRSVGSDTIAGRGDEDEFRRETHVFRNGGRGLVVQGFSAENTAIDSRGHDGEWVVEDATNNNIGQHCTFPNFGSTFFYDCAASTKQHNLNLTGDFLCYLVPPGITDTLSATRIISPAVLEVTPPKIPNAGLRIVKPNQELVQTSGRKTGIRHAKHATENLRVRVEGPS